MELVSHGDLPPHDPGDSEPDRRRPRLRPASLGPATVAFIAVVMAIGFVTERFGLDAGLLVFVLALVALVIAPYIYLPTTRRSTDDDIDPQRRPQ